MTNNIEINGSQPLSEVQQMLIAEIESLIQEATHSILGERPDGDGEYSEAWRASKEMRDDLQLFLTNDLFRSNEKQLLLQYPDAETYLIAFGNILQTFSDDIRNPLTVFVQEKFSISIEKVDARRITYETLVRFTTQMSTKSEAEIREKLNFGDMDIEEMRRIAGDVVAYHPKGEFSRPAYEAQEPPK